MSGKGQINTLTVSNVVEGPLIILEKRVPFDFVHSVPSQTHVSVHNTRASEHTHTHTLADTHTNTL